MLWWLVLVIHSTRRSMRTELRHIYQHTSSQTCIPIPAGEWSQFRHPARLMFGGILMCMLGHRVRLSMTNSRKRYADRETRTSNRNRRALFGKSKCLPRKLRCNFLIKQKSRRTGFYLIYLGRTPFECMMQKTRFMRVYACLRYSPTRMINKYLTGAPQTMFNVKYPTPGLDVTLIKMAASGDKYTLCVNSCWSHE